MRHKKIEKDGAVYFITPLNLRQVDELVAQDVSAMGKDELLLRSYNIVCASLNNYAKVNHRLPAECVDIQKATDAPKVDDPWTPEKLREELDLVSFNWLQSEILDFSGLKLTPVAGKPGEARATERVPLKTQ